MYPLLKEKLDKLGYDENLSHAHACEIPHINEGNKIVRSSLLVCLGNIVNEKYEKYDMFTDIFRFELNKDHEMKYSSMNFSDLYEIDTMTYALFFVDKELNDLFGKMCKLLSRYYCEDTVTNFHEQLLDLINKVEEYR